MLSSSGLPVVGLVALILATWTTNVSNAYSGGLSLSVLLGQDEKKSQVTTAVAGIIGTVLAAAGILNSLQGFLSLLSAIVPALIGTLIRCVEETAMEYRLWGTSFINAPPF